jgi:hypothetical protein
MAFKIDKKKEKELHYIANRLQPTWYDANSLCYIKGEELISKGKSEVDGKPVDPEKVYQYTRTVPYPVNHKRRIMKAYIDKGNDGVVEYLKAYNHIMRPHPINLGSQL